MTAPGNPEPTALVVQSVELGVVSASSPAQLVARATEAANALAGVIADKKLFATISGRQYVKCEGWTTLAAMMGCLPREVGVTRREDGTYEATVELARMTDGAILTRASAECGMDEPTWKGRADYARRSMAVTRATSKACRIAFSWVMVLAGYEPTPADEIPREETVPEAVTRLRRASKEGAEARRAGLADDEVAGVIRATAGRGQSPVGRTKDASIVTPPVQSLEEFPKQLIPDEVLPFEALTRDQPCPISPKGTPLAQMRRNQLKFCEAWLDEHPAFPRADEWRALVTKELDNA